jgi:hypothetical protein
MTPKRVISSLNVQMIVGRTKPEIYALRYMRHK